MIAPRLGVGDAIEVRVRFNDSWSSGFEIASVLADGYQVRRTHDRVLIPGSACELDVRPSGLAAPWA